MTHVEAPQKTCCEHDMSLHVLVYYCAPAVPSHVSPCVLRVVPRLLLQRGSDNPRVKEETQTCCERHVLGNFIISDGKR